MFSSTYRAACISIAPDLARRAGVLAAACPRPLSALTLVVSATSRGPAADASLLAVSTRLRGINIAIVCKGHRHQSEEDSGDDGGVHLVDVV